MGLMSKTLFLLAVVIFAVRPSLAHNNDLESWYAYWGLGYVEHTYPNELQHILDDLKGLRGVDHLALALDQLGFYWPQGDKVLIGGIVTSSLDAYAGVIDLDIRHYLYALSVMYFPTHRIGEGFFMRGDMGLARMITERSRQRGTSNWGTGLQFGVGYGVPVTSGTRILAGCNLSARIIDREQISTVNLMLNGLF